MAVEAKTCRHIRDTLDIESSDLANSMVLKLQFFVCLRMCNTASAEDKRSRPEWERRLSFIHDQPAALDLNRREDSVRIMLGP